MAALASLKCAVLYARDCLRFERTRNPFVYTPGDHEWTYCHRLPNRSPEEADLSNRPGHLRSTFFSDGRDPPSGTRRNGELITRPTSRGWKGPSIPP
jgi:hypothetical protein